MSDPGNIIAYQGAAGAYSHLACVAAYPDREALPCATFEDTFQAVNDNTAELAMVPIENSIAGRVADIHQTPGTTPLCRWTSPPTSTAIPAS